MSGELEPYRFEGMTADEVREEVMLHKVGESSRPPGREQSPPLAGNVGGRPDFVMVGMSRPGGGVILFASLTLTEAELKHEVGKARHVPITPNPDGPFARIPDRRITVRAEMQDFTQIVADTYPAAMQTLQEQWSRRQPGPGNALPPGI